MYLERIVAFIRGMEMNIEINENPSEEKINKIKASIKKREEIEFFNFLKMDLDSIISNIRDSGIKVEVVDNPTDEEIQRIEKSIKRTREFHRIMIEIVGVK